MARGGRKRKKKFLSIFLVIFRKIQEGKNLLHILLILNIIVVSLDFSVLVLFLGIFIDIILAPIPVSLHIVRDSLLFCINHPDDELCIYHIRFMSQ